MYIEMKIREVVGNILKNFGPMTEKRAMYNKYVTRTNKTVKLTMEM